MATLRDRAAGRAARCCSWHCIVAEAAGDGCAMLGAELSAAVDLCDAVGLSQPPIPAAHLLVETHGAFQRGADAACRLLLHALAPLGATSTFRENRFGIERWRLRREVEKLNLPLQE